VFTDNATTSVHGLIQSMAYRSGTAYTAWTELSKENGNLVALGRSGGTDAYTDRYAVFDLNAGTIARAPTGGSTANIVALGGGKYLCSVTWASVTDGSNTCAILAAYASDGVYGNEINRAGAGNARFRIHRAQLNEGTYPLQYEQTTDNQILYDLSGNGLHGQLGSTAGADVNDPTWMGQGLSFAGDDFDTIADNAAFNFGTGDFTISATFKSAAAGLQGLITKKGWNGVDAGYALYYNGTTRKLLWSTANGVAASEVFADITLTANTPYDVMMVRQNSHPNKGFIVVNGVNVPLLSAASVLDVSSVKSLRLGNTDDRYFLTGDMYHARVYNRALTDAEISRNYHYVRGVLAPRGVVLAA
jgi:hypothetical protein